MSKNVVKKVGALTVYEDGDFMIAGVPTWYTQLVKPEPFKNEKGEDEGTPKFRVTAYLDNETFKDEIAELTKMAKNHFAKAAKGDWDDVPKNKRIIVPMNALKTTDPDSDAYDTTRLKFSANEGYPPTVRTPANVKLNRRDPDDMETMRDLSENGRYMTILGSFYAQDNKSYGAYITMNLKAVKVHHKKTDLVLGGGVNNSGDDVEWGDAEDDEDVF